MSVFRNKVSIKIKDKVKCGVNVWERVKVRAKVIQYECEIRVKV